jgi:hypothetical protein
MPLPFGVPSVILHPPYLVTPIVNREHWLPLALGTDEDRHLAGQNPAEPQPEPGVHVVEYLRLDGHRPVRTKLDIYRLRRDLDPSGAAWFLPFYVEVVRINRLH